MADISFEYGDDNHLTVTIETERLHMQSVTSEQTGTYVTLLESTENMAMFADGQAWATEKTRQRVSTWVSRWHQNIPFSSLAVTKNDSDDFIGHVVLGYGDDPGCSELAYVFDKKYWGHGYGKESVKTVVKEYAPELVKRNYKVEGNEFTSVVATARSDNDASIKILEATGMKCVKEDIKFGHNRHTFFIDTKLLIKQKQEQQETNLEAAEMDPKPLLDARLKQ